MDAFPEHLFDIIECLTFMTPGVLGVRVRFQFTKDMFGVSKTAEMPPGQWYVRKPPTIVPKEIRAEFPERLGVRHDRPEPWFARECIFE
jgi:hypothetical protein